MEFVAIAAVVVGLFLLQNKLYKTYAFKNLEYSCTLSTNECYEGDEIELDGVLAGIREGRMTLKNVTRGECYPLVCALSERQCGMIAAGGLLNYTKMKSEG